MISALALGLCLLVPAASPYAKSWEKDGVRIEVEIHSPLYTYHVTNVDAPPIASFELVNDFTYNHHGPDGWSLTYDQRTLRTSAEVPARAIRPGETRSFDARTNNHGASLGLVTATVGFEPDSGRAPVVFASVWGPVAQRPSLIALILATMIAVGLVHAWLAGRGRRSDQPSPRIISGDG